MIVLFLGCLGDNTDVQLDLGDSGEFVETVEPVLTASCANPSCHGNVDRPLQIYAVHRHRMDPADAWADGELTADETRANFLSAAGFSLPPSELARKPLDPAVGGMSHLGGVIWQSTEDPDYEALRAWSEAP